MLTTPPKFSDAFIRSLPYSQAGQQVVRESLTPGFMVVIGKKTKTFSMQVPVKVQGKWTSRREKVGSTQEMSVQHARKLARLLLSTVLDKVAAEEQADLASSKDITLREAWAAYKIRCEKKNRSQKTIDGYEGHFTRYMGDWLDIGLSELADKPLMVEKRHDKITRENGKYAANGAMRALRAVFNHAAKKRRNLKGLNPVEAVDMNPEERRQSALTYPALTVWFEQLWRMENPIRREFHFISLLSGSRPTALKEARWKDLNLKDRYWHFPKPKGGTVRAFDLPLSKPLLASLIRIRKTELGCTSIDPDDYIFPADSLTGHIEEIKEKRATLIKVGNDLRQSFATFATACNINELQIKMLKNHKMVGVTAGYVNLKPLWPILLENQMKIAHHVFEKAGNVHPKFGTPNDRRVVEK